MRLLLEGGGQIDPIAPAIPCDQIAIGQGALTLCPGRRRHGHCRRCDPERRRDYSDPCCRPCQNLVHGNTNGASRISLTSDGYESCCPTSFPISANSW